MFVDPASTQSIPVDTPVLPAVLPVFDAPNALIALWFVCEFTLNWNWLPVVLRIVIAPNSDRPIVPDV